MSETVNCVVCGNEYKYDPELDKWFDCWLEGNELANEKEPVCVTCVEEYRRLLKSERK